MRSFNQLLRPLRRIGSTQLHHVRQVDSFNLTRQVDSRCVKVTMADFPVQMEVDNVTTNPTAVTVTSTISTISQSNDETTNQSNDQPINQSPDQSTISTTTDSVTGIKRKREDDEPTSQSNKQPSPDQSTSSPSNQPAIGSLPLLCVAADRWQWKPASFIGLQLQSLLLSTDPSITPIITRVFKVMKATDAYLEFGSQAECDAAAEKMHNQLADPSSTNKKDKMRVRKNAEYHRHDSMWYRGQVTESTTQSINQSNARAFGSKQNEKKVNQSILDQVTPLHALPYEKQLYKKQGQAVECLKKAYRGLSDYFPNHSHNKNDKHPTKTPEANAEETVVSAGPVSVNLLNPYRADGKHMLCDMDPVIPSPILTGYRNKCEFSIGHCSIKQPVTETDEPTSEPVMKSIEGRKTVGFLLGSFTEGVVAVEPVDECINVPEPAKLIARKFSDFLNDDELIKHFNCYDKQTHTGLWRLLTVRYTSTNDCMVIVQLNPEALDAPTLSSPVTVEQLHNHLVQFFDSLQNEIPIHSIYTQHWSGRSNAADSGAVLHLLKGEPVIHEIVLGLKFRVSPTSFLQTNTKASEQLYTRVIEWATQGLSTEHPNTVDKKTVVLDICCGTGTIGLIVSQNPSVASVVGIELNSQAVDDAKANAELNGIQQAQFICGKAEESMDAGIAMAFPNAADRASAQVVAIVDPPRSGLHGDVIKAIRKFSSIRRCVYVSCNPKTLVTDLVKFCQPEAKRVRGKPFSAKRAVACDMFPGTDHCEMIVLLERD